MQLSLSRPTYLGALPPGESGTRATLDVMRRLARRFKTDDTIRTTAIELTADLPPKDWAGQVRALFTFVRDRIRYTRDVFGVETLQTPIVTLDLAAGDCDDKSTLLAALLLSIGHPARFVAVGFTSPGNYQHVYVETLIGKSWFALDPTVQTATVGWRPPRKASATMRVSV